MKTEMENSSGAGDIVWQKQLIPNLDLQEEAITVYF